MDVILKPETTDKYHHVPVRSKDKFVKGSFRTIDISVSKGIKAVIGKLKTDPQGSTVVQKYLFDVDKWTMDEAKAWVKEHGKKTITAIMFLYKDIDISSENKITKFYKAKVLSIDEENHRIKARVSTGDIDRHKEIIEPTAWKKRIKSYMSHPVLLSSHDYRTLRSQIGEAVSIDINDKGMDIEFEYYVGEGNEEADWAWVLASKGKAMFSVGFIPIKNLEGEEIPKEISDKYKGQLRRIYKEVELIEASQVVVGSNRGALQMGIDNPDTEQCNYMYEVVRSFGQDIPDIFNYEGRKEPNPEPNPKNKIDDDSHIISPVVLNDMKELSEIVEIIKSGRVISEKNRKILQGSIEQLTKSVEVLNELLKLSEPKNEGGGKGTEIDVDSFIERTNEIIEKLKS